MCPHRGLIGRVQTPAQVLQRAPLGLYMAALAASVLMWPGSGWKQVGPRVGAGTAACMGALVIWSQSDLLMDPSFPPPL